MRTHIQTHAYIHANTHTIAFTPRLSTHARIHKHVENIYTPHLPSSLQQMVFAPLNGKKRGRRDKRKNCHENGGRGSGCGDESRTSDRGTGIWIVASHYIRIYSSGQILTVDCVFTHRLSAAWRKRTGLQFSTISFFIRSLFFCFFFSFS